MKLLTKVNPFCLLAEMMYVPTDRKAAVRKSPTFRGQVTILYDNFQMEH